MKILEPSCGDGSFLRSIKKLLNNKKYNIEKIDAVEYIKEESDKSAAFGRRISARG